MQLTKYILILILLFSIADGSESHKIRSTEEFVDILSTCASGDTLFLENGVYLGSFELLTPVVIVGDSGAVIDGDGEGDIITILADSITLDGLTIENSGTRLLKDHAGIKIVGDYVNIKNCKLSDILHGIYIKGGNRVRIINNTVLGRYNIQESDRGNGIHLWNTSGNEVVNNEISFARDGIYFSFANNTKIENNHIHKLRYALHYMYSDSNSFHNNLFDNNVAGSALMFSKHISFTRNVFAHCRGFRAYGILLQSVEYCTASDNLILDNTKGVFFDDANHNRFENNDIVQNDLSIHLNASCENNVLVNNNFISNLAEVEMDASVIELTTWWENGSGNFWSGYSGYDLDGDGVGDIPIQLQSAFEYLELDYPAIRFYLYSPASQLLAAAERRLPILRKSMVEDKHPLFKRAPNPNVPYGNLEQNVSEPSYGHLLIWIAIFLFPLGMMWVIRK